MHKMTIFIHRAIHTVKTMKNHFLFFLAAFIIILNAIYWPMSLIQRQSFAGKTENEATRILLREAELVEHFCLSRYAPAPGRATIPAEWEKVLGSQIRLRDGVGEIVSDAAELQSRAEEIRQLAPGQTLQHVTRSRPQQHVIVKRPIGAPNQFLFISKTDVKLRELADSRLPFNPAVIAAVVAAAAALILTILRTMLPK
jgi:hypothetical protein